MLPSVYFFGSLGAGILVIAGSKALIDNPLLKRLNYAGREVPTAVGFVFVPVYLLLWAVVVLIERVFDTPVSGAAEIFLILVPGMCFLGLLDDLLGSREARGFKGHMGEALRGRITTGFLKALGGFLVAMAVTYWMSGHIWEWFLNSALIALCANFFNLLDMRPGRALKVFFPLFALVVGLTWHLGNFFIPPALSVGAVALVLLYGDLSEEFMLGDAGSNVLGATVGLGLVLGVGNWWRLGILMFIALLTLLSEKYSFSRAIESNMVLNWLDRLGRKGEKARGANK